MFPIMLVINLIYVCQRSTRDIFLLNTSNVSEIFELIHSDLWRPYKTMSTCGASYFLTILDDYSRAVQIYLIAKKNLR